MKTKLLPIVFLCLAWIIPPARAQSSDAAASTRELTALITRVQDKLRANQKSAAELAPELAAFDALRAKYSAQRTDEVAQITLVAASLYGDVLGDTDKAKGLLKELKESYHGHPAGARAEAEILAMEQRMTPPVGQTEIIGKPAPEINFTWSTRKDLKKLSDLKGKVVVLDFWATWCGPCLATFPQIRELTAHYKDLDVVVVGVTSLQGAVMNLEPGRIDTRDNPQKEFDLMTQFIKAKQMTWTVAFSEERVFNPSYGVAGIPHMAIIAPDGTVRHNGIHPAMPHAEKVKLIDPILKEFAKLPAARTPGE
jgi:thiol-disulfide isomerase/thioredoxin